MISTITSTHLTVGPALSATLVKITVLLLLGLLVLKELASNLEGKGNTFGRVLTVAIVPLLMTFGVTVVIRIVDVLRR